MSPGDGSMGEFMLVAADPAGSPEFDALQADRSTALS